MSDAEWAIIVGVVGGGWLVALWSHFYLRKTIKLQAELIELLLDARCPDVKRHDWQQWRESRVERR